ncbi:MAG TPA: hypothetical protein VL475_00595, partial [Planctomycetaceae bacterium]|nr:hypothetical protein [Planctomycetaceae bacterium]
DEFREKWVAAASTNQANQTTTESPAASSGNLGGDGEGDSDENASSSPINDATPAPIRSSPEEQLMLKSLTNLCHALMNSAEFIYID